MSKEIIKLNHLTKDYGYGKGIFNLNLTINEGEMVGFIGTNGSGKTTTIRSILGFIKPTSGEALVNGLNSRKHYEKILKNVGYVPGEIAFPDLPTGNSFIKSQGELLGIKDYSYALDLADKLALDLSANLKRMSKGMKQKTALVSALMNDPKIIILDEPTTGLDPLMRDSFLEIIKKEHAKGKTILMSSHIFEELETTCDRVAFIANGKIIDIANINAIRDRPVIDIKIEFISDEDYQQFCKEKFKIIRKQDKYHQLTIEIDKKDLDKLFTTLTKYKVSFYRSEKYTLEKHFKLVMKEKEKENNVQ